MLRILLIEDDAQKAGAIDKAINTTPGLSEPVVVIESDVVSAKERLTSDNFDVLILDIQLPIRFGQTASRDGGVRLLQEIVGGTTMRRPRFIVGITAYKDIAEEFEKVFAQHLFGLVQFDLSSSQWKESIQNLLAHAVATKDPKGPFRIKADLAVLCALEEPEHSSILELPYEWSKLPLGADSTIYYRGTAFRDGIEKTVIAAACPQMGMPACAAIAMKMIQQFCPRFIAITGIAAGFQAEMNIGDIVVADPIWDYSNGKVHRNSKGQLEFLPEPVQIRLDPLLKTQVKLVASEPGVKDAIRNGYKANKPDTVLNINFGPVASGPLVLAARVAGEALKAQHRKLCAVDMEMYGLFVAAMYSPIPSPVALSIKGISDYADEGKDDSFRSYAAYVSASLLHRWAERYL